MVVQHQEGKRLVCVDPSRCSADMNVDIIYILSLDRSYFVRRILSESLRCYGCCRGMVVQDQEGKRLVYVDPSRCSAGMNVDTIYVLSLDRS